MNWKRQIQILATGLFLSFSWFSAAIAAEVDVYCVTNPTTPPYQWTPCQSGTPLATSGTIAPSSSSSNGITSVVSASAENNHVFKNSPGNLYGVYATNLTATAGFLVLLNATSAPGDGAITPLECVPLPANGNASINYDPGPPAVFSTGITAVVTSANTCFTKTTGVITAYLKGSVQ